MSFVFCQVPPGKGLAFFLAAWCSRHGVPCGKAWRGKIPQRSEDDFSAGNEPQGRLASRVRGRLPLPQEKRDALLQERPLRFSILNVLFLAAITIFLYSK